MMPIWLQLAAALTAALASGVLGKALVPFLQKMRFCEPEPPPKQSEKAAENILRPTMCGLLLVFGSLAGAGITYTLYRTFRILDSTSVSVQQELRTIGAALCFALFCAALGFACDWRMIRRRPLQNSNRITNFLAVFLLTALFMQSAGMESTVLELGFMRYDAGLLYLPLNAAAAALLWLAAPEEEPDGTTISVGGVMLLCAAVLFMQQAQELYALLSLSAAGACMGCLVWNLHPAKCRLGKIGIFWMYGIITAVCLMTQQHMAVLLLTAVCAVNRLPALRKHGCTLQKNLADAGMKPWQRIAVLTGFTALTGAAAMMINF